MRVESERGQRLKYWSSISQNKNKVRSIGKELLHNPGSIMLLVSRENDSDISDFGVHEEK